MERDKSRGLKHMHDKKKYKPKSKSQVISTPKPKPKQLESNWDRYDEEESDGHNLRSSTDFAILANVPIIKGSHFQFKSDKYDLTTSQDLQGEIFNLDMNLLNMSMSTIPTYEFFPCKDLFSVGQMEYMDKRAEENLVTYKDYVDALALKSSMMQVEEKLQEASINEQEENTKPQVVKVAKDANDLETWLDDILDD